MKSRKTIFFHASLAVCAAALSACSSPFIRMRNTDPGPVVVKMINVSSPFRGIVCSGAADVEYTEGPLSVSLTGDSALVARYQVLMEDGSLVVRPYDTESLSGFLNGLSDGFKSYDGVTLKVSAPAVNSFLSQGAGDITIRTLKSSDAVSILSQGSGDVRCGEISCSNFTFLTQGAGDLEISKLNAANVSILSQGVGDVNIEGLEAGRLVADSQGSGDILVAGKAGSAKLVTSGTGDIDATNLDCADVTAESRGSGEVSR